MRGRLCPFGRNSKTADALGKVPCNGKVRGWGIILSMPCGQRKFQTEPGPSIGRLLTRHFNSAHEVPVPLLAWQCAATVLGSARPRVSNALLCRAQRRRPAVVRLNVLFGQVYESELVVAAKAARKNHGRAPEPPPPPVHRGPKAKANGVAPAQKVRTCLLMTDTDKSYNRHPSWVDMPVWAGGDATLSSCLLVAALSLPVPKRSNSVTPHAAWFSRLLTPVLPTF